MYTFQVDPQTVIMPMDGLLVSWLFTDQDLPKPNHPPAFERTEVEGDSRRIFALLAEDNRADVLMIEEAIITYHLPVDLHVVDDGEKASEFIDRIDADANATCPDLLLLDLNLPRRSGVEVLEHLRNSRRCKDIPVLIITSGNLAKERAAITRLGADGYFRKSPKYEEFLKVGEAIKAILDQRGK